MKPLRSVLLVVAVAGCGLEPDASTAGPRVERGTAPLEAAFDAASREYQVPVGLLKAVAYVETRVSMLPGQASLSGGYGVMQLSTRADWNLLARAAQLTGADEARLKVDAAANVRGAAAVLRELFDKAARSDASLRADEAGDWFYAVSLYPGFDSATDGQDYATDVFLRLEAGFAVQGADGSVVLAPQAPAWRRHAPTRTARRDALGDYPGIYTYRQSPNYSSGRSTYEFVVIHTTQGSYAGAVSWFLNTNSNVSSQYVVRSSDGQITQMVSDGDTAWHAQCYNRRSIGIEHEGYVQDPSRWYTDAMYGESAKLTRWLCDRHNIAKNRTHIIGHVEVAPSCNTGGHTDPGTGWNWTKYMGLVLGSTPTPSTGVLIGAIYTGGNTANRLSGAVVTVNGQSVTTAADGLYQFTLPAGSYTATVAKAGYGSNTVTRTVTAGAQVWGSMEVNPVAQATGTLRGKVFAYNAANPSDMTVALSGAAVAVAGQSATTGADGMWSFSLAPGTYTVSVAKAGYQSNQVTRAVTSGTTTWGSVGLSGAAAPDTQAPQLAITFPADNAELDLAMVQLTGTASDDRGAVAAVKVSLNGGAETEVPVASGRFQVEIQLRPGSNALAVKATDAAGNTGTATSKATFNAGVGGVVHLSGDELARVAGATVELLESGSGTRVSTATTDATGAYSLAVMTVPADYVLVVKAAGFVTSSETVTVPGDRKLTVNVALVQGQDTAQEASLAFVEPLDGATVTTDTVTVYGRVTGYELAGVKVNGVTSELLGAGGFAATVPLVEGANVIEAVAAGVRGETLSARITVTRKAAGAVIPGPGDQSARGGCSTGAGLEALVGLVLLPLLRRRRR